MDPPPTAPPSATAVNLNYPDSVDSNSSPRSTRIVENWADEHLPHVPGAKLRLMCSYGGHIMPRPHDKTLCYVGGDTRIVVVDRHSSLKDLCNRLSRTLLHGRPFTLKYQLPNEDLDNLISVATDEDLENMIEEHDRLTAASPPRPSRLRLFLFFTKPESSVSMGSLLDDAKSETWFVDALNNSGILTRGVSDSATVECLVNLDGAPNAAVTASDSSNNLEAQAVVVESHDNSSNNNKQVKNLGDVSSSSLPDSPMVEKNSSYGSSSSSPSMANLPPIRVRADENGGGSSRLQLEQRAVIEEQFAQMTFGGGSTMKHDDGYPMTTMMLSAPTNNPMPPIPAPMENTMNRVISDDERSDQGAPVGLRKPPLPLQPVPRTSGGLSLPSPDSVASDSSIASANSFSRTVYYQDQAAYIDQHKAPVLSHSKSDISDPNSGFQREQQQQQQQQVLQDSNLTHASLLPQMDQNQQIQQQYVQANTHYIHHHPAATGTVPISSYYQVYAAPSQQQISHPMNHQQYPVYMMPVGHTQAYNMGGDPNVVGSVRPIIATATPTAASYKDGTPPIYPTKPASPTIPEAAAQTLYKAPVAAAAASSAAYLQIPSGQYHQQQYMGVPQIHHHQQQPQSMAVASSAANYGYDYGGNPHEQSQSVAYYTQQQLQQQIAPLPSQYQSMSPAVAAAALSDASKQFPAETIQQPNRTTQPV